MSDSAEYRKKEDAREAKRLVTCKLTPAERTANHAKAKNIKVREERHRLEHEIEELEKKIEEDKAGLEKLQDTCDHDGEWSSEGFDYYIETCLTCGWQVTI